jgi:hypothetical protein
LMWGIYTIYLFQSGRVERGYKFEHKSNVVFVFVALVFLAWILSFLFRTGH